MSLVGGVHGLRSAAGGADRIVVVDTETTGVYPSDRIVEIALVTLSLNGEVLDVWETLVQPQRDIGASFVHGITAGMVTSAPTFPDIAGDVAVRLEGACLAAHNLSFDGRMLCGEFERLGVGLSIPCGLDTLRATRARLSDACAAYDVQLTSAHRALVDAMATARLLLCVWQGCEPGAPAAIGASLPRSGRVLRREDVAPVRLPDPPLITYLASRLSHTGVDADLLAYLELVDRCIGDLHLDMDERRKLTDLARQLGLGDAHVALAHRRFVNELIDAALEDHELSVDEYDQLLRVAAALGVDESVVQGRTQAVRAASMTVVVRPGMKVVFTGDCEAHPRPQLVAHAEGMGLDLQAGVTKKTDLLVAADPDSSSGKASKARRYGIPVVSAARFAAAHLGEEIQAAGTSISALKVVTCPDCLATWTVSASSGATSSKRCDACVGVPRSAARATPEATEGLAVMEVLVCATCGSEWKRQRTRGRKPSCCPECSGSAPQERAAHQPPALVQLGTEPGVSS